MQPFSSDAAYAMFFSSSRFCMHSFLGALANVRKTTIGFVMPLRLFVRPSGWNSSAPTGQFVMTFGFAVFFEKKMAEKFKFFKV
jgi:hypothetical protein